MPPTISDEEAERYSVLHKPSTEEVYLGDSCPQRPWPQGIISAEPFTYGPIIAPYDIRVLILYPAEKEDDPIECVLAHRISSEAQYQALSYTWGDGRTIRKILCNGGVLSITENLYAALLDIRNCGDRDGISFVWADAICINQGDRSERESQVKMMKDIYWRAMATVVDRSSR
jgi:Heterokaryon incompatibility protein (HET)